MKRTLRPEQMQSRRRATRETILPMGSQVRIAARMLARIVVQGLTWVAYGITFAAYWVWYLLVGIPTPENA